MNIRQLNKDDLVDEKLARQTRLEFEKFFGNGKEPKGGEPRSFIVKDENANGSNKFARLSPDAIKTLLKIFDKVERGGIVTLSGKKGLMAPQQARLALGLSVEEFLEMTENKEIKIHKINGSFCVYMKDVIKCQEKIRKGQRELLKELAQEMQAEMNENSA